jgi:SAM-dependent methyltransferase
MRSCPACGELSAKKIGVLQDFEMVRCNDCGTVFTSVLPSSQEEAEDYSAYYHEGNLVVPDFVAERLDQLVSGFDRYRRRNRWLDVGCGAGTLLRAAGNRGWDAVGTEVSAGAVDAGRSQGLDVRLGELADLGLDPAGFDVVSLVEVLEHVPEPRDLLSAAAGLVRPGGVLYVTTPHGRGISARLLGTRWSVMAPPEHLQLLSAEGLRRLTLETGMRPLRLRTEAVNPRELLAALRRDGDIGGGERVKSGYRLNEALSTRRSGRVAKAAVNSALNATRLGDALKLTAERPA